MKHALAEVKGYREMRLSIEQFCWWCGRTPEDTPVGWHGPFLIERSHIVSSPRIEDRRVVALMCSRCHRVQHGEVFARSLMVPRPELGHLLWLKRLHDVRHFDLEFLAKFHVGRLPELKRPGKISNA